ncbi:MAG: stage III sporulation protein AF [Clostridia bacterium]|nr:stage III sporulation protein AF [Clostridia bacterium]
MNLLKEAVMSICITAVCVGVIEMLLPKGSFRAPMKLLTGTVLIISLITPILNPPDIQFDVDAEYSNLYKTELYDKSLESLMQNSAVLIKQNISGIIYQNGISSAKIKIIMDKDHESRIVIKGAEIYLNKSDMDRADKLIREIKGQTGIDVRVEEEKQSG